MAWGIESVSDVPTYDTSRGGNIVEILAAAENRGCLLSELADEINIRLSNSSNTNKDDQPNNSEEVTKRSSSKKSRKRRNEEEEEPEEEAPPAGRFNTVNIHPFADKLVANLTAVKRIILPTRSTGGADKTVRSRNNYASILHLKRFASFYEPGAEGMEFLANESVKEQVFMFILRLLELQGLTSIPLNDLGTLGHHCPG